MVFFVTVTANVCDVVRNVRLKFCERPTLHELATAVESHFTSEMIATPLLSSSFLVDTMMLFDEYTRKWVELFSTAQLSTDCQVCALHMHAVDGHRAKRRSFVKTDAYDCPTMVPSPSATITRATPPREVSSSSSSSRGMMDGTGAATCCCFYSGSGLLKGICSAISGRKCTMTFGERIRALFDHLDGRQKGYLLYTDIRHAIHAQRKYFINYSAEVLFEIADRNGDNRVSYKEWVNFAVNHPEVVDTLLRAVQITHSCCCDNTGVLSSNTVLGQRPRRKYLHKLSELFFRELDRGFASPYVVLSTGALLSLAGWKFLDYYVEPNRQQDALWRRPQSRVPLSDVHNSFWGFGIGSDSWKGVPSGRHSVEAMTENAEEALRRPMLLHSEASELQDSSGGALTLACMEIPEYDARTGNDAVYRSVHYMHTADHDGIQHRVDDTASTTAGAATSEIVNEEERRVNSLISATDPPPPSSYLSRMPARGLSVIHGMVKCRSITSLNNCMPSAGHLESEYSRKMMLALGPVHILRDIAQTSFPLRFTYAKETPVSVLVCGLHSGEIPRWLSNAFPNFHVDVVERDGALARICRRFMGFQESSNLRLFIADPIEFLRRTAVHGVGRRYDLIMVDAMDGAGQLNTQYGRLEFINSVRNSLTGAGCVITALPNRDGAFLYNIVQNWRIAFAGRSIILVHCVTSPHTMLMTFQDDAERGRANFGTVANVEEFRDLLRTKLSHYGPKRVPFDFTREVSSEIFRVLAPGKTYPLEQYLPVGHPQLQDTTAAKAAAARTTWSGGVNAWLKRVSSMWLTPAQQADLRRMER